VNFAFSPMWFRIPFVACTSMFWTCILSAMRGGESENSVKGLNQGADSATDTFGSQGRALDRILARKYAYENPRNTRLVLTVTGEDKEGIAGALGSIVFSLGGNVGKAHQINMGTDFSLMMEVIIDKSSVNELTEQLHSIQNTFNIHFGSRELQDEAERQGEGEEGAEGAEGDDRGPTAMQHFMLAGPDRPGIVSCTMRLFAEQGVSVSSLQSELFSGPSPRFVLSGDVGRRRGGFSAAEASELRAVLERAAAEMGLELTLESK